MLIGITGPICAGKHTTAEYLVQHHGFLRLHLPTPLHFQSQPTPSPSVVNQEHTRQHHGLNGVNRHHSSNQSQSRESSLQTATTSSDQSNSSSATSASETLARLLPSVTDQKGTRGLTFPDVESLLEFVTKRWREHWVLTDIYDEATLEALLRRPFFLLLNVDAPVGVRYSRFSERCRTRNLSPMPLADFIYYNDLQLYGSRASASIQPTDSTPPEHQSHPDPHPDTQSQSQLHQQSQAQPQPQPQPQPQSFFQQQNNISATPSSASASTLQGPRTGIIHLISRSHLQILNAHPTLHAYFSFLTTLDLPSPIRLRPTWDAYFMTLASLASRRSNCMKRRVGCVLVHNFRIISTGYNGTPRNLTNCNEGGCARCNSASSGGSALSTCLCLHAEENALLEAGRERIKDDGRTTLYCDTCPCLTCSVKIAQVGVKEVVYTQGYNMDEASRRVLGEAGVVLRQFSPPKSGLVGFAVSDHQDQYPDLMPGDDASSGKETSQVTLLNTR
ncbi:dCMP deaminase [Capronia coronata CBS 617.96]|uniref:Deoxycytidylate deaminase n=1 Tax=Capronia coronata CBS 617.96 TaxID=1182541 RepID=W9YDF4_9EURO|nr:dCMP deaminase [Capronia coronata CBS 617.96]EXJ90882.1 dCMP deaminase [Capronia coronata CBS 617.96]